MTTIEQIAALKKIPSGDTPFGAMLNDHDFGYNNAISAVLSILEADKPVDVDAIVQATIRGTTDGVLAWFSSDNVIVKRKSTGEIIADHEITVIENPQSLFEEFIKPGLLKHGISLLKTKDNGR